MLVLKSRMYLRESKPFLIESRTDLRTFSPPHPENIRYLNRVLRFPQLAFDNASIRSDASARINRFKIHGLIPRVHQPAKPHLQFPVHLLIIRNLHATHLQIPTGTRNR
jgi:hypothetical protein